MSLTLYKNSKSPNDVTPELTTIASDIPIRPTSSVSVMNPTYVLDYNSGYLDANFCYDSITNRYYWITDKSLVIGQTITLTCSNAILANTVWGHQDCWGGVIVRSGALQNITFFPDDQYPLHPNKKNFMSLYFEAEINYPLSSNSNNYVICICNGGDPFYPPTPNNNSEEEET